MRTPPTLWDFAFGINFANHYIMLAYRRTMSQVRSIKSFWRCLYIACNSAQVSACTQYCAL